MREKYLKILGLDESATEKEIKKAWKKKAIQFHPDKNPNKNAQNEFIKICDAYEKLTTNTFEEIEGSLPGYNRGFYKKYNKNLTPEELEIRLHKAREHANYKKLYEENIHSIAYSKLKKSFIYKFSNIIGVFSLIIGSIIFLDFLVLEYHTDKAVVLSHAMHGEEITYTVYDLNYQLPKEEREYEVYCSLNDPNFIFIENNNFIFIKKSRILNEYVTFSSSNYKNWEMKNTGSIYIGFWAFFIIFFLPIINFVARGPNAVYLIFIHINAYLPIFASIGLLIGLS